MERDENKAIITVIAELRMACDEAQAKTLHLMRNLSEADANIRSLMDENAKMQARITQMVDKYETQRQS